MQPGTPVTLDNCESEPIHAPGAIQPYGVLFACDPADLRVKQVSANVASVLGVSADSVLGRPLTDFFIDDESLRSLAMTRSGDRLEANSFRMVSRRGSSFDAGAHRSGESVIVEIEHSEASRVDVAFGFDPRMRASVLRLQRAKGLRELMAVAVEEVRTLTGFDRVMIYRFDSDWNGEVVAESKRAELEPFLGLHYPASDIPAQARRLYTANWLRFVVDIDYRPVLLVPQNDPATGAPLDLSHSMLRSVSPIHCEYLRNMGVTASMSISLVIDGVLAGLIACHHYSGPRLVSMVVRNSAEYLGNALSWQLHVLERAERAERARAAQHHETEVIRSLAVANDLLDGMDTPALLALASASGAAVVLEDGVRSIGETPAPEQIAAIVAWLRTQDDDVYVTDRLARALPDAACFDASAAGVLAVPVARELGEYILWFRPAVTQVVEWAGDPRKSAMQSPGNPPRLSPRGSFALWREEVKGRSLPWEPWEVEAASSLRRVILAGVRRRSAQLRGINERLLDADRVKDEFIATVSHELRNPLNVVSGWTNLLRSGDLDPSRSQHALEVIERNVGVQLKLVDDLLDMARSSTGKLVLDLESVDIAALVNDALDALSLTAEAKELQLVREIDGNAGAIRGDADRLRQILSNLVNNAIKFTPSGGRICVRLMRRDSDVELSVTDTGKGISEELLPHVFEPFRQADTGNKKRSGGLGLGLAIVKQLVELHGGNLVAESEGERRGATFRVHLPGSSRRS